MHSITVTSHAFRHSESPKTVLFFQQFVQDNNKALLTLRGGNPPVRCEVPLQKANKAENVSMPSHLHGICFHLTSAKMHSQYYCEMNQIRQSIQTAHVQHHDDVIIWKHFPRYWLFVRGIHQSPAISPHKGQWRGALMFSWIYARINGWVNNREAGDMRRHQAHCDVIIITIAFCCISMSYHDFDTSIRLFIWSHKYFSVCICIPTRLDIREMWLYEMWFAS